MPSDTKTTQRKPKVLIMVNNAKAMPEYDKGTGRIVVKLGNEHVLERGTTRKIFVPLDVKEPKGYYITFEVASPNIRLIEQGRREGVIEGFFITLTNPYISRQTYRADYAVGYLRLNKIIDITMEVK